MARVGASAVFSLGQQKPHFSVINTGRGGQPADNVRTRRDVAQRHCKNVKRTPDLVRALVLTIVGSIALVSAESAVDAAFRQFWSARTLEEAATAANVIAKSGVRFDDALVRLKKGRPYSADVPRGVVRLRNTTAAADFPYTLDVPPSYDPSRKYQVRIQLHGGVGRPDAAIRGNGSIGALAGAEQIYVLPSSWADAPWWGDRQLKNLHTILDALKRTYNVDENRVAVSGVSDGGTGAYYIAMRETTSFASFLPLNGFVLILANPSLRLTEQLFPQNLANKPLFVVNGGRDPLYPTAVVEPYVRHLQRGGVSVEYQPQPEAGHNTAWWPEVRDQFEAFVRDHPREPHPVKLTWSAEAGVATRAHWVIVDTLAVRRAEAPLADLNDFAAGSQPNFGVRAAGMRVTSVLTGTNADQIGLKPGDLVLTVNGRTLPAAVDLLDILSINMPGEPLTLGISRDQQTLELTGVYDPQRMARVVPLFSREKPAGRVDAVREGNIVRATTRGVSSFTVLASPDAFDFTRPIVVVADGRTVFNARVGKSVATLARWAAIDNDRTMLYGAEIHVRLQ